MNPFSFKSYLYTHCLPMNNGFLWIHGSEIAHFVNVAFHRTVDCVLLLTQNCVSELKKQQNYFFIFFSFQFALLKYHNITCVSLKKKKFQF